MNDYENRQFMIFNVSELPNIDFTQVLETSEETNSNLKRVLVSVEFPGTETVAVFHKLSVVGLKSIPVEFPAVNNSVVANVSFKVHVLPQFLET